MPMLLAIMRLQDGRSGLTIDWIRPAQATARLPRYLAAFAFMRSAIFTAVRISWLGCFAALRSIGGNARRSERSLSSSAITLIEGPILET